MKLLPKSEMNYLTPENTLFSARSCAVAKDSVCADKALTEKYLQEDIKDFEEAGLDRNIRFNYYMHKVASSQVIGKQAFRDDSIIILVEDTFKDGTIYQVGFPFVQEKGLWKVTNQFAADDDFSDFIIITRPNKAPRIVVNTTLVVNQGDSTVITNEYLAASDPDDEPAELSYTVTAGPYHGQLEFTDALGTPISSYTQQDIDNNRLSYVHDGLEATTSSFPAEFGRRSSDSFDFSLTDGGEEGVLPMTGSFNIHIHPQSEMQ